MELSSEVLTPEVVEGEINREVGDALDIARQVSASIVDDETRMAASKFGAVIAGKLNILKDLRDSRVTPLRKAYEGIRDLFDVRIKALDSAKRTIAAGISAFDIEVERKARFLREEAERKAREEREAYEKAKRAHEAEIARIKADEEAKEQARLKAEAAAKAERDRKIKEEEDARLKQAQEALKQGNTARVDPVLDKVTAIAPAAPVAPPAPAPRAILPPPPPPPVPVPLPPVVARRPDPNTVSRDVWKMGVTDLRALIAAVAEGRAPLEYLTENMAEIGKDVRKLKEAFSCSGVTTWKERLTSLRAGEKYDYK